MLTGVQHRGSIFGKMAVPKPREAHECWRRSFSPIPSAVFRPSLPPYPTHPDLPARGGALTKKRFPLSHPIVRPLVATCLVLCCPSCGEGGNESASDPNDQAEIAGTASHYEDQIRSDLERDIAALEASLEEHGSIADLERQIQDSESRIDKLMSDTHRLDIETEKLKHELLQLK